MNESRAHEAPRLTVAGPSERDQVVSQLADVRVRMAHLKEQEKRLAARVRVLFPAGTERVEAGGLLVTVKHAMTFSPERAKEILSPKVIESITVEVSEIDAALAEQILPGAVFEACKVPRGEPRITLGGK